MERLKHMKEMLMNAVEGQISGHLDQADAKELGEAIDMIKDLSEAVYYCTITEAMEGDKKEGKHKQEHEMYYPPMRYYTPYYEYEPVYPMYRRGVDGSRQSMGESRYYGDGNYMMYRGGSSSGQNGSSSMSNGSSSAAEGRSAYRRRMYMDGKHTHHDKMKSMQELEAYMQDLATDMAEMVADASPEEKQLLQSKISSLATKIK